MAKCVNCGTEMTEGTKFCPSCGKPVEETQKSQQNNQQEPTDKQKEKMKKAKKGYTLGCLFVIGLIVLVVVIALIVPKFAKHPTDMVEVMEITGAKCIGCGKIFNADTTQVMKQRMYAGVEDYISTYHDTVCAECKEKKAKLEAEEAKELGSLVGKWRYDPLPATPNAPRGVYSIRNKNGSFKLFTNYDDGSSGIKDLLEKTVKGQKRLIVKNNDFGEYYVIESDGKLGEYDNEGLITKMNQKK